MKTVTHRSQFYAGKMQSLFLHKVGVNNPYRRDRLNKYRRAIIDML